MFTFNMHNINEMCFNHVFKKKIIQSKAGLFEMENPMLSKEHQH